MSKFTPEEIATAQGLKSKIDAVVSKVNIAGKSVDEITNEVKLGRKAEAEKNGLLCVEEARARFKVEGEKLPDKQDYPEYFYDEGHDMLYKLIRTVKPSEVEGEPDQVSTCYKHIA